MKTILQSLKLTLVFAILLGVLYPLVVFGVSQIIFPKKANGSLIERDGKVVGSELIGQNFSAPQYFHSRPSAAGKGYDAQNSSGSNLGLTSEKLIQSYRERAELYRKENNLKAGELVPLDAVAASGSGLDPHISPANATMQLQRVAAARNLEMEKLTALVASHTDRRFLGFIGDDGVNVVTLNVALDTLQSP